MKQLRLELEGMNSIINVVGLRNPSEQELNIAAFFALRARMTSAMKKRKKMPFQLRKFAEKTSL